MKCEAVVLIPVTDKFGKPLPPEEHPCSKDATYSVTRHFTGITQALCGAHARRFKDDTAGFYTVRSNEAQA